MTKPTRQTRKAEVRARKEAEAKAAARRATRRRMVVFAVAGLLGYVLITFVNRSPAAEPLATAAADAGRVAGCTNLELSPQVSGEVSRDHEPTGTAIAYDILPPAAGTHAEDPLPTDPRVLDTPPDEGQVVHTLEHGSVVLSYRPSGDPGGLSSTTIEALAPVANGNPATYLAPAASLPDGSGLALRAWNVAITCPGDITSEDATTLAQGFVDALACSANAPEARLGDGC